MIEEREDYWFEEHMTAKNLLKCVVVAAVLGLALWAANGGF